jgi:hypothetical protein
MSDNSKSIKSCWNWSFVCNLVSKQLLINHNFVNHFKCLSTNEQRVKYCLSQQNVNSILNQFLTIISSAKHRKYWEKAKEFRTEGNDLFRKKCFEESVEAYNQVLIGFINVFIIVFINLYLI